MTHEVERVINFEQAKMGRRRKGLRDLAEILIPAINPGDRVEFVPAPKGLLEAAQRYYNRKRISLTKVPQDK